MKILDYNKKTKVLTVQFSSNTIWEYFPVELEIFTKLITCQYTEKMFKQKLRSMNVIGVNKGIQ